MRRIFLLAILFLFSVSVAQAATISKVAFERGGFIYVKDMKTGVEKRIAKGSYPSISTDGTRVAYISNASGSPQRSPVSSTVSCMYRGGRTATNPASADTEPWPEP